VTSGGAWAVGESARCLGRIYREVEDITGNRWQGFCQARKFLLIDRNVDLSSRLLKKETLRHRGADQ
jgi:hypothetical protein